MFKPSEYTYSKAQAPGLDGTIIECIHDPYNLDDKDCIVITTKGHPCSNPALINKNYCSLHYKICHDLYTKYKGICNKVWDAKCFKNMTAAEIRETKKLAELCARLRLDYTGICMDGQLDESHAYAMTKMVDLARKCDSKLKEKKQKRRR